MLNLIKKCFVIAAFISLPFFSIKSAETETTDTYLQLLRKLEITKSESEFASIIGQLESQNYLGSRDGKNRTPLFFAVNKGFYDQVKSLIDKGADVNATDNFSTTPLMNAARLGHEDIVKLLLDNNAKVNNKDKYGITALMRAAVNGNEDVIKLLLHEGANITLKNKYGKTAYDIANEFGHDEIAKLIKQYENEYQAYLKKWSEEAIEKIVQERKVPKEVAILIAQATIPPTYVRWFKYLR